MVAGEVKCVHASTLPKLGLICHRQVNSEGGVMGQGSGVRREVGGERQLEFNQGKHK